MQRKKINLDKIDKQNIRKIIKVLASILTDKVAFTGNITLNFFEGNYVNADVKERIK